MIKISVIIPIYNVGFYLQECVNSVIKQTYKNLEIILVDDGSTDECPNICDTYAKQYSNVKVVHKQNGGLSDARNVGILNSTGDYLLFLDADDFWKDSTAVQSLVDRINLTHADLLNYSYIKYYEDLKKYIYYFEDMEPLPLEFNKLESIQYLLDNNLYIASACNKLIKKSLFEDGNLYFVKGIYSEDIDWCLRLLIKAESVDFICENFYCYRQRSGSITHTINDKKCHDLTNNILKCFSMVNKNESLQDVLYKYVAYQYGTFFITQAVAENYQSECINELSKYKWVLKYHSNNKKLIILNIMVTLFGYKLSCKIIRF
ncbi:glycosyltransferase family 2 protein, partial [Catenibacterium mitsuokai]|uniref:glycosyltransferase family 2 protein n=1 Tax=Catenibacterium mitsuokai TaxID=100886 RepID=UPI003D067A72